MNGTTPRIDPAQVRLAKEIKHTSPLLGCRFDPTGTYVFAGAQDNTVQRFEVATGKKTALAGHESWVRGLAYHVVDRLVYTAGYDGQVMAWTTDNDMPIPVRVVSAHDGWVRAVAVSPDGSLVATCGNDGLVKLWSSALKAVRTLTGHACHVYNVAFHPGGKQLVSADLKGALRVWDVATGAEVRQLDGKVLWKYDTSFKADIGGARSIGFSPDGKRLAVAGITDVTNAFAGVGKPMVVVFDWDAGTAKVQMRPKDNFQGTMWGVAYHPEGFVAAVGGGNGGGLWFFKPDTAQDFHTLKLPNNARDVALSPDGTRLAIPFQDGAIRLYDVTAKTA